MNVQHIFQFHSVLQNTITNHQECRYLEFLKLEARICIIAFRSSRLQYHVVFQADINILDEHCTSIFRTEVSGMWNWLSCIGTLPARWSLRPEMEPSLGQQGQQAVKLLFAEPQYYLLSQERKMIPAYHFCWSRWGTTSCGSE